MGRVWRREGILPPQGWLNMPCVFVLASLLFLVSGEQSSLGIQSGVRAFHSFLDVVDTVPSRLQTELAFHGSRIILDTYESRTLFTAGFAVQAGEKVLHSREMLGDDTCLYHTGKLVQFQSATYNNIEDIVAFELCEAGISGYFHINGQPYKFKSSSSYSIGNSSLSVTELASRPSMLKELQRGSRFKREAKSELAKTEHKSSHLAPKPAFLRAKTTTTTIPSHHVIELYAIVDGKLSSRYGTQVFPYVTQVINYANALLRPVGLSLALVHLETWRVREYSGAFDRPIDSRLALRYMSQHRVQHARTRSDYLHMFTGSFLHSDASNVRGSQLYGASRVSGMCTWHDSIGVSAVDVDNRGWDVRAVASNLVHEIGHSFGLYHDDEYGKPCRCEGGGPCIMADSGNAHPTKWSNCSLEHIHREMEEFGFNFCLKNVPESLVPSRRKSTRSVCGNGVVESGEECDCGPEYSCTNPCCDATTCRLTPKSSCAHGDCCDLTTCSPRPAATTCRPAADLQCDLPEYCDGSSPVCPDNFHTHNGAECNADGIDSAPASVERSYCRGGMCATRTAQCRVLWGHTGESESRMCYDRYNPARRLGLGYCNVDWEASDRATQNVHGCGSNRKATGSEDVEEVLGSEDNYCGALHCSHRSEVIKFWTASSVLQSESDDNVKDAGKTICHRLILDSGPGQVNPAAVPDGSKCGEGRVCLNRRCATLNITAPPTLDCEGDCGGHGVCNNLGHCHCEEGFAPPNCEKIGVGGSIDSGPSTEVKSVDMGPVVMASTLLGALPAVIIIAAVLFCKRKCIRKFFAKFTIFGSGEGQDRGGGYLSSSVEKVAVISRVPTAPAASDIDSLVSQPLLVSTTNRDSIMKSHPLPSLLQHNLLLERKVCANDANIYQNTKVLKKSGKHAPKHPPPPNFVRGRGGDLSATEGEDEPSVPLLETITYQNIKFFKKTHANGANNVAPPLNPGKQPAVPPMPGLGYDEEEQHLGSIVESKSLQTDSSVDVPKTDISELDKSLSGSTGVLSAAGQQLVSNNVFLQSDTRRCTTNNTKVLPSVVLPNAKESKSEVKKSVSYGEGISAANVSTPLLADSTCNTNENPSGVQEVARSLSVIRRPAVPEKLLKIRKV